MASTSARLPAIPFVRGLAVVTLCLLAPATASLAADPDTEGPPTARFVFSVQDGETWIKSMETHSSRDYKARMPYTESSVKSDVRLTFDKGTQGTTTVTLEPLFAETKVNGEVQENRAQQLAVEHATRLHLDESGRAVAGDGFDELMRAFERELDAKSYAQVRQQMNAESMKFGEMAEWNRPLRGLRGEEVRIGDTWQVLDEKYVQGNWIPLSGTLSFDGWTELDGEKALKVTLRYDGAGTIYEDAAPNATKTLNFRPEDRGQYNRHNLMIEGKTTWLLSPERGMPLYENHEERMLVPLSLEEDADRGEVRDSHIYRYRPEKSSTGS